VSILSTFYVRIFCTKVHSKPNSKQRKAAQKIFIQQNARVKCWWNWPHATTYFFDVKLTYLFKCKTSTLKQISKLSFKCFGQVVTCIFYIAEELILVKTTRKTHTGTGYVNAPKSLLNLGHCCHPPSSSRKCQKHFLLNFVSGFLSRLKNNFCEILFLSHFFFFLHWRKQFPLEFTSNKYSDSNEDLIWFLRMVIFSLKLHFKLTYRETVTYYKLKYVLILYFHTLQCIIFLKNLLEVNFQKIWTTKQLWYISFWSL